GSGGWPSLSGDRPPRRRLPALFSTALFGRWAGGAAALLVVRWHKRRPSAADAPLSGGGRTRSVPRTGSVPRLRYHVRRDQPDAAISARLRWASAARARPRP